jgi:hypothetical protein
MLRALTTLSPVLIVSAAFLSIPSLSAQVTESMLSIRIEYSLAADGGVSGTLEITATGHSAELVQQWLANLPASERHYAAGYFLDRIAPGANILTAETTAPGNSTGPVSLQCSFRNEVFAPVSGGRLSVPTQSICRILEVAGLDYFVKAEIPEESVNPVPVGPPLKLSFTERVTIPEGYHFLGEEARSEAVADSGSLIGESSFGGSTVTRALRFELLKEEVASGDLEAFRNLREGLCAWRPGLAVERSAR